MAERIDADKIGSWDMVFDPETVARLADCSVAVLDSPSEVMAPALNYLGLDPNSEDKADLAKAEALMMGVRPYVRYFHSSQYINDLANGDICVSIGYSGDVLQARDRAAEAGQGIEVAYTIPREGAQVGFDMMAIPDDAPNPENALKFINYILQPKVAADITNWSAPLEVDTRVAHRAVHLRVTEKKLNRPRIAGLPTDLGDLCPAHRMSAVGVRLKADRSHPHPDQPSMLPGRDVKPVVKTTGLQVLRAEHHRIREPSHQGFSSSLADLEADRFPGLALNN